MKVYTNTSFEGLWPVGTSAVIVAESAEEAADVLRLELDNIGLTQEVEPDDMVELGLSYPKATVLNDGNY